MRGLDRPGTARSADATCSPAYTITDLVAGAVMSHSRETVCSAVPSGPHFTGRGVSRLVGSSGRECVTVTFPRRHKCMADHRALLLGAAAGLWIYLFRRNRSMEQQLPARCKPCWTRTWPRCTPGCRTTSTTCPCWPDGHKIQASPCRNCSTQERSHGEERDDLVKCRRRKNSATCWRRT